MTGGNQIPPGPPPAGPPGGAHDGLYQALMAYYLHQDRLLWSRTQLLIAVQGAVLAGGYYLRGQWLAAAVMLLGAFLTGLIFLLVIIDQKARDLNLPLMDRLVEALAGQQLVQHMRDLGREHVFRFTETWFPSFPFLRGSVIISFVLSAFIVIDIVLACLFACCHGLFQ